MPILRSSGKKTNIWSVGSSLCATRMIRSCRDGCFSLGLSPNCCLNCSCVWSNSSCVTCGERERVKLLKYVWHKSNSSQRFWKKYIFLHLWSKSNSCPTFLNDLQGILGRGTTTWSSSWPSTSCRLRPRHPWWIGAIMTLTISTNFVFFLIVVIFGSSLFVVFALAYPHWIENFEAANYQSKRANQFKE